MIALGVSSPPSSSSSFGLASFASPPSSSLRILSPFPSLKSSFRGIRIGNDVRALTPLPSRGGCGGGGGRMVVRMAKRREEMKEIREKTTEELNEEVIDLKGELFMLRLQKSARNEFKSSEFHRMRKRIARMLTVKREREIEEGINKRLSRKLDKKWKKSIVVRPPPSLRKKQEEQKAAEAEKST
ncbi:50S ribosomal protein L29, chloroplastic-like [Phoenix dactylifera]|uniref:Large ribosomal subunit protein uL29c n=1 Tax=Phoenix dactylifera TaxID=42345 RepID=A0A8B7CMI2_PHODC|nr:50S ribosomal protein L29, chloroplastic-like [Phoenix dactylifera]